MRFLNRVRKQTKASVLWAKRCLVQIYRCISVSDSPGFFVGFLLCINMYVNIYIYIQLSQTMVKSVCRSYFKKGD